MDFCCGATMTARIRPLHSERGMLLTDVPFLVCRTCGQAVISPALETQVTMYVHHCETDGVKQASLLDIVDELQIQDVLLDYPSFDSRDIPTVSEEQMDHMLDVWNFATLLGDTEWVREVKDTLLFLHQVLMKEQSLLQESS